MKVMAGLVEADTGTRILPPQTSVGYMEQDPTMAGHATLGDYAASGLELCEAYRVERAAEGLKFDPPAPLLRHQGANAAAQHSQN